MKSNIHPITTAVFLSILTTAAANASNLVINGSFEDPLIPNGAITTVAPGNGLTGWTIAGSSIDLSGTYWQPAEGSQSISLNQLGAATISQTLTTAVGNTYHLSFFMAAEPYGGAANRTMDVLWDGGIVASPSFTYTGQPGNNLGWVQLGFDVLGTGSDVLAFRSTTAANYGPTLDGVSVQIVPEPSATLLFVSGVAFCLRRRSLRTNERNA